MKRQKRFMVATMTMLLLLAATVNVHLSKCCAAPKVTQITFWHACSNETMISTMRAIIARFEAKNKNIKVRYQAIPWAEDPHFKYQTAVVSGSIADVFTMGDPFELVLGRADALEPLNRYLVSNMKKDFPKWAVDRCTYNKKIIALPLYMSVRTLFYRKDLLKEAGVPEPTSSWTWEQFIKYAKLLTKDRNGDGVIDQYGFGTSGRYVSQYFTFFKQNGADFVDEKKGIATANSPNAIEALKFYIDLIRVHKVTPPGVSTIDLHNIQKMFAEGKVAMFIDAEDTAMSFAQEPALANKLGIGYLPHRTRNATYAGADVIGIAKNSPNKKAAWEFMKYVLAADNVLEYCKSVGFTPVRTSIEKNAALQDPIRQGFIKQMRAGSYFYYGSPNSAAYSRIIKAAVQEAIEGIVSPTQAAEMMQTQLTKEIRK